jgi:hypothetical protein
MLRIYHMAYNLVCDRTSANQEVHTARAVTPPQHPTSVFFLSLWANAGLAEHGQLGQPDQGAQLSRTNSASTAPQVQLGELPEFHQELRSLTCRHQARLRVGNWEGCAPSESSHC